MILPFLTLTILYRIRKKALRITENRLRIPTFLARTRISAGHAGGMYREAKSTRA